MPDRRAVLSRVARLATWPALLALGLPAGTARATLAAGPAHGAGPGVSPGPAQPPRQPLPAQAIAPRLRIGQSVPMTGPGSDIGMAFAQGARLGLVPPGGASRLALRQLDDGGDPARAAANAQRLLEEGCDLLFGFVGTAACEAAARVAGRHGVPLFAPFGAADGLRRLPHVLHVRPALGEEALHMARLFATLGQERIGVLGEEDALGHAGAAAMQQALVTLRRPPPVARVFVPASSPRSGDALARLLATQPQAIVQASQYAASAQFVRLLRAMGYAGSFLNFSVVGIEPLAAALAPLGPAGRGVAVAQVLPAPHAPASPLVRDYLAALEPTDLSPGFEGLEGYVAGRALREGLRRAVARGGPVWRQLASLGAFDLGGLGMDLRGNGRRGIELAALRPDGALVR